MCRMAMAVIDGGAEAPVDRTAALFEKRQDPRKTIVSRKRVVS